MSSELPAPTLPDGGARTDAGRVGFTADVDISKKVDVLLKEHEIICTQIREMVSYSDRIFGFGITIFGALLVYGAKEAGSSLIIAMPFAIALVLLFCMSVYAAVLSLGGYRRYVEESLSAIFCEKLLRWEQITPKILHNSVTLVSLSVGCASLLTVSMYRSWLIASAEFGARGKVCLGAAFVVTVVLLVGSYRKLRRSHREAYQAASTNA